MGYINKELSCMIPRSLLFRYPWKYLIHPLTCMYLLLPPQENPMNIIIIYDPIYNIPFIPQVSSSSPIYYQLPMENLRDIYTVSINNSETDLSETTFQLLCEEKCHLHITNKEHLHETPSLLFIQPLVSKSLI